MGGLPIVSLVIAGGVLGVGAVFALYKLFNEYISSRMIQDRQETFIRSEVEANRVQDAEVAARDAAKQSIENNKGDIGSI